MSEPVVSREAIAKHAEAAAKKFVEGSAKPVNPYPHGSAAAEAWEAALELHLLPLSIA